MKRRCGCSMPDPFEPRIEILPPAQKEIWPQLIPAPGLSLVLYGGTAVALHLPSLSKADQDLLRTARDGVSDVPDVHLSKGLLPA